MTPIIIVLSQCGMLSSTHNVSFNFKHISVMQLHIVFFSFTSRAFPPRSSLKFWSIFLNILKPSITISSISDSLVCVKQIKSYFCILFSNSVLLNLIFSPHTFSAITLISTDLLSQSHRSPSQFSHLLRSELWQ